MSISRRWCFTINNHADGLYGSINWGVFGMLQGEIGAAGTKHLQGFVVFDRNQRLSAVKKLNAQAHWEVMKGTIEQSEKYCSKIDTRNPSFPPRTWGEKPKQGHRTDLSNAMRAMQDCVTVKAALRAVLVAEPEAFLRYHRGFELAATLNSFRRNIPKPDWRPWQLELETTLTLVPNNRTIHWFCDIKGGQGKSTFVNYYINNESLNAIKLSGKVADMAYAYNSERIVFFDVSRTQAEHMDHLYQFAEELKNGALMSTKYASTLKVFEPPHVVFFSNTLPLEGKWSADRLSLVVLPDLCPPTF